MLTTEAPILMRQLVDLPVLLLEDINSTLNAKRQILVLVIFGFI